MVQAGIHFTNSAWVHQIYIVLMEKESYHKTYIVLMEKIIISSDHV